MRVKGIDIKDGLSALAQSILASGRSIDELPLKVREKVKREIATLKEKEKNDGKSKNARSAVQAKPKSTKAAKKG